VDTVPSAARACWEATRVAVPTPFSIGPVNVYLVDGQPLTLIDVGPNWPASLRAVEDALFALGRRLEEVELVLLTHQHNDHVGLAATIKARTSAQIVALAHVAEHLAAYDEAMAAEQEFTSAVMRRYGLASDAIAIAAAQSRSTRGYGQSVVVDRVVNDGDIIAVGNRNVRVLSRPGHSPGDTIYALGDDTAFVGDHVLARISSNPVIHRPVSGSVDPADRDPALALYIRSLERTREEGYRVLRGGHGEVVTEPECLIALRLEHHRDRKEQILALVRGGRRRVAELIEDLWSGLDQSQLRLALSEVLGHTDLLVAEGSIAETVRHGVAIFEAT
jgi:glyoxylase-like metal-dependent hydrolase (beta-lactamase superfamily II)